MREIKFRAWDKGKQEMITANFLILGNMGAYPNAVVPGWKIMQYTGLKDKNGKEIYEGDILQWCDISIVKTRWAVERTDGGWYPFVEQMLTDRPDRFKVIGNIYENPELIERS